MRRGRAVPSVPCPIGRKWAGALTSARHVPAGQSPDLQTTFLQFPHLHSAPNVFEQTLFLRSEIQFIHPDKGSEALLATGPKV